MATAGPERPPEREAGPERPPEREAGPERTGGPTALRDRRRWAAPLAPLPVGSRTVAEILERRAGLGHREFLVLPDARLSFADADELANRAAAVLADHGCRRGDIVMARCENGWAMAATWFACAKLGAVFMPVNALLTGDPLRNVMAAAGARLTVCDAALLPSLEAVRGRLPALTTVLVAGSAPPGSGHPSFDRLVESAPSVRPTPPGEDPGAPAKLMYTSGTTGTPKGVLWSRHCEATWGGAYVGLLGIGKGEGAYCCLPMFHVTCQGTILGALLAGGRVTIDAGFDAFRFWSRVRQADAAVFTFVGTILSALAKRRERPDDADNPVRRILGAAAPTDLWREIERRFAVEIVETWGQTETASCWTSPPALPQRPGTVGRVNERWEARVVGPDGVDVADGVEGELWMRPRHAHVMFEGYLSPEGVTDEAWTSDGWYRTGDLLLRDEHGDFAFRGRLREAIRRRGEMIAAGEIEAAALAHPDVVEAAAVGVPAESWGEEEIKLCVVLAPEATVSPPALLGHLTGRLPRFMVPRYIDVRPEMPKTPSTRVQKYVLRDEGTVGAWDFRGRPDISTAVDPG